MMFYKCDRCGKEIESPEQVYKITYWILKNFPDENMDLCKDCHNELLSWLNLEKEKEEDDYE